MSATHDLERRFDYNHWANRQVHASLKTITEPPPRARAVFAHIIGAEWLWLGRLETAAEPAIVWPELSLDECSGQLEGLSTAWTSYLRGLSAETLQRRIAYVNSLAEPWENTVADMLMHVIIHSAYHRGQIATLLGRAGHQSAYADYIHFIRRDLA